MDKNNNKGQSSMIKDSANMRQMNPNGLKKIIRDTAYEKGEKTNNGIEEIYRYVCKDMILEFTKSKPEKYLLVKKKDESSNNDEESTDKVCDWEVFYSEGECFDLITMKGLPFEWSQTLKQWSLNSESDTCG